MVAPNVSLPLLARLDWPQNNHDPNPELVDQLLSLATSPAGLSAYDFAKHRIDREDELNYKLSAFRDKMSTGEVGLILPTLGVGQDGVLPPNPADVSSRSLPLFLRFLWGLGARADGNGLCSWWDYF